MTKNDHKSTELARLFFLEMPKIHAHPQWSTLEKAEALGHLLELLFLEVTKVENIQFTTLFARIAFACHKYQVEKKTQYWVHFFRKKLRSEGRETEAKNILALGFRAVTDSIVGLLGTEPSEEVLRFLPKKLPWQYAEIKVREFRKSARVIALQDEPEHDRFIAQDESNPSQLVHIQYNIAERNEPFSPTVREIRQTFGFPITLNLLDVEVVSDAPNSATTYRPRTIIVEPDYLLDVSAVADCFQGYSAEPMLYVLKKFLPIEPTVAMMVGNIANFFLDELMHNPAADFRETFPKVFKISPLQFSLLPDATIREVFQNAQKHFLTLKLLVTSGMKKFDIEPSECYLEPSFVAESCGLQGRLDVFFKKENRSAIIELKSGQPFMPNRYGIGASHFIQTLLYDLMVRQVFGETMEPGSYILYSGLETNQLRYAPPVKAEQNEALQLRNQMVSLDRQLALIQGKTDRAIILEKISTGRFPQLKGFHLQNIAFFEKTYSALDDLERSYFNAFTGFIAREHQLAKTGVQGIEKANGLAALWLDSEEEKEANFQIIKSLKIRENRANQDEPLIVFQKTETTNPLANFRPGDIAILYPVKPSREGEGTTITTQIFKVTILTVTKHEVVVRLRYRQFNQLIFSEFEHWNLEHDHMDMGFLSMYQGLYRWAQCPVQQRKMMLSTLPPEATTPPDLSFDLNFEKGITLTKEQQVILRKMLVAKNYFLLWGPPGTGKTSQMLKHFAGWIFENTSENLLLLAYTNRAVDEICEALDSLGEQVQSQYLRIGSRYSTDPRFEKQLLSKKTEAVTRRAELIEVLGKHRIFISTLASLSNNLDLLKLKKFRRVVIDEASQILEPSLVGLLPQFEQFVLVGDHKQLPAVVVQDATASAVNDEKLHEIGLQNLRNSLFERLYRRCVEQGWHWAFDHLSHQGRMHEDIMRFPARHFYEGKLQILPSEVPESERQRLPLAALPFPPPAGWQKMVSQRRIVFLPTPSDTQSPSRKTNRHEAALIAELVQFFKKEQSVDFSIGVITPYRAQIAQVQEALQQANIPLDDLTIDTVERYQGGARDIILISLCTNAASQMDSLVSLSAEGVDRKLNVALTRARERVVILGNPEILSRNEVYRNLIEFCESKFDE